jgi:hypothetical protein
VRACARAGRVTILPAEVVTSSRRFDGRGFPRTFARWSLMQVLFWLGVSPHTLGRLYAPVRKSRRGVTTPAAGR